MGFYSLNLEGGSFI